MVIVYLVLAIGGVALVCWGLPAAHRLQPPKDTLAALAVLAGTVAALLGALLVVVPGFFKG